MKIGPMVVCGLLALCLDAFGADLKSGEKAFAQRDYPRALREFRPLAEKGDPTSQRYLGDMYRHGYGVAPNLELAVQWLKRSADGGDPLAQATLGSIFLDRKMYTESAAYYAQAAKQDNSEAQLQLGYSYALGQGVQMSAPDASKWFQAACRGGSKFVSLLAGTELRNGKIIPKDPKAAAVCLERASSFGDLDATATLGVMYLNGEGVSRDFARALGLFQSAANGDSAEAFYGLGLMYEQGSGVRQDYSEAAKYFLKAARKGLANAQVAMGKLYEQGNGMPVDYREAVALYEQAARQGSTEAQYILGQRYAEGKITAKDHVRAYMMLNLAAATGHEDAHRLRDSITTMMTADQIAAAQRMNRDWTSQPASASQAAPDPCAAYFGVLQDDEKAPGHYVAKMTSAQATWYLKNGRSQFPGLCLSLEKAQYLIIWSVSRQSRTVHQMANRTASMNTSTTGQQNGTFSTYGNLSTWGTYSGTSSSSSWSTIHYQESIPVTITSDYCSIYVLKSVGPTIWDDVRNKTPQRPAIFSTETRGGAKISDFGGADNAGAVGLILASVISRAVRRDPTMHALVAALALISVQPVGKTPASQGSSGSTGTDVSVVSITSSPDGAEITVDGTFVGSTPSIIRLGAGVHEIGIARPGFDVWKRTMTVNTGGKVTIDARLETVTQR